MAKAYDISKNHLMKVAYQLGVAGYVETVRGRGGGLRLAKLLEAITLGEVVRRTEPDMALRPVLAPIDATCAIKPCCALRTALKRATTAFTDVLDEYTLKDLAKAALLAPGSVVDRAGAPGGRAGRQKRRTLAAAHRIRFRQHAAELLRHETRGDRIEQD